MATESWYRSGTAIRCQPLVDNHQQPLQTPGMTQTVVGPAIKFALSAEPLDDDEE